MRADLCVLLKPEVVQHLDSTCQHHTVAACHVMSVLSGAAAEHHGSWESVQRVSSTHLRRLTHFPKVKLHGRLSSVPCTLIYCFSLCLFLNPNVSLVFSLNLSLSVFFFLLLSFFTSHFFSLCLYRLLSFDHSRFSLSTCPVLIFGCSAIVLSLNLFLHTFLVR